MFNLLELMTKFFTHTQKITFV